MSDKTGRARIRVDKSLESRDIRMGAVARLRCEIPTDNSLKHSANLRQTVVIPVGGFGEKLDVNLTAGLWSIEVDLPWGETIQEDFTVVAGQEIEVAVRGESSPRETLSWHHYAGAVEGKARHEVQSGQTTQLDPDRLEDVSRRLRNIFSERYGGDLGRFRKSIGAARSASIEGVSKSLDAESFSINTVPFDDFANVLSNVSWTASDESTPASSRAPNRIAMRLWKNESSFLSWVDLLNASGDPDQRPFDQANDVDQQVRTPTDIYTEFQFSAESVDFGERYWVHVEGFGERRLLSVPAPWHGKESDAEFHVLVRFIEENRGLAQLIVRDEAVAAMLGYMTADKLHSASVVADTAKAWLFDKIANPLAAAGGGYVMLGTRLGSDDTEWRQWIRNLSNWFDWLPDAAILEGSMCLNGPKGVRDLDRAAKCFRAAYLSGLPYYTLGLSWLRSGLSMLKFESGDFEEMFDKVSRVARMAETNQAFTTLRLPSPPAEGN